MFLSHVQKGRSETISGGCVVCGSDRANPLYPYPNTPYTIYNIQASSSHTTWDHAYATGDEAAATYVSSYLLHKTIVARLPSYPAKLC